MKLSLLIATAHQLLEARGDIDTRIECIPAVSDVPAGAPEMVLGCKPAANGMSFIRMTLQVENTPNNQRAALALRDTLFTAGTASAFNGRHGCMKLESVTLRDFMGAESFQLAPAEEKPDA